MREAQVDYSGLFLFMIAMIIGAWGVHSGETGAVTAIVILLAGGIGVALYVLMLVRHVCRDISEINKRQEKWFQERRNGQ